nr:PREDICTED: uncharacterized protein LOC102351527 isoform X2 [Latimeria chalumnae]|eukprot:XP_014351555.1 PREDICTED: uncharacterized protein LOC102351527 isoform X2 [Latimeria chalumnae]
MAREGKMAAESMMFQFPAVSFSRSGNKQQWIASPFKVVPYCLEFHRILRSSKTANIILETSNQDVLNTIIALYDVCLPEIGAEELWNTVCAKEAKTIVLIRDKQEVLKEYQCQVNKAPQRRESSTDTSELETEEDTEEGEEGMFSLAFSDTESSEEESSSESGTESDREERARFNAGAQQFITSVMERRQERRAAKEASTISLTSIGIECQIVGAVTYLPAVMKSGEKVVKVTLLSTRKRYRKCGVGRYMLELLKDPSTVGPCEALVTHADAEAIEFFIHCDFSDDLILNHKFKEFEDDWTNTTMMSYFFPFSFGKDVPVNISEVKLEMELWKTKSFSAYQAQSVCMSRLLHEVATLRKQVTDQRKEINSLKEEIDQVKEERYQLAKTFLEYKIEKNRQMLQMTTLNTALLSNQLAESTCTLELATQLAEGQGDPDPHLQDPALHSGQLAESACSPGLATQKTEGQEDLDLPLRVPDRGEQTSLHQLEEIYNEIVEEFLASRERDPGARGTSLKILNVIQALVPADVTSSEFSQAPTRLYYCGGLDQPWRLKEILQTGFSQEDFHTGTYGKGLYFSPNASTACLFSPPGEVLVANVRVGSTEVVMGKDRDRTSPSEGFGSILVPGRLDGMSVSAESDLTQEYVIFNLLQASPTCLLIYKEEVKSSM